MFRLIVFLASLSLLSGCAYFGNKVTDTLPNGTVRKMSQTAFIAQEQFKAETACHNSKKVAATSIPSNASAAEAVAIALAGVISAMADNSSCGGTNVNDVAIARSKAIYGLGGKLLGSITAIGVAGEIADFGKTLARTRGDTTFNSSFGDVTQSTSTSSIGGSGGDGGVTAGLGGGGDTTKSGVESNTINIGGDLAVAGDRAASGDTALVNGDSSLQSLIDDSELKQSPLADDQPNLDNSNGEGFSDDDGGNGLSLDF